MNRIIAPIIARYTSQYIEGLDAKDFQLSIFEGSISLSNLTLKRSALAELDLPVDVVKGTLSSLEIKIPWTNLKKEAVEVTVDELLLLVKPKSFGHRYHYVRLTLKSSKMKGSSSPTSSNKSCCIGGLQLMNSADSNIEIEFITEGHLDDPKVSKTTSLLDKENHSWKDGEVFTSHSKKTTVVMKLLRACTVASYRIQTASTPCDYDPEEWVLEGSLGPAGPWRELHSNSPTDEEPISLGVGRTTWSDPIRFKNTSDDKTKSEIVEEKRMKLNTHDELLNTKLKEEEVAKQSSYKDRLIETIINNIQLNINAIHIRFEDDVINPAHTYIMGATLSSLTVCSTDISWTRCFITEVGDLIRKNVQLEDFSLYMDHKDTTAVLSDRLPSELWQKLMLSEFTNKTKHNYLLYPLSLDLKLAKLSNKGKLNDELSNLPGMQVDVHSAGLSLGVNRKQVVSLLEITQFVQRYSTIAKYQAARPNFPVHVGPAAWWKFALKCVIKTIRSQQKQTDKSFSGKKKIENEYINAYKKLERVPWIESPPKDSKEEKYLEKTLETYDYYLPVSELQKYRADAIHQIAKGKVLYGDKEAEREKRRAGQRKQQSWGSWLSGMKVKDTEEDLAQDEEDFSLIDEQAKELLGDSPDIQEDNRKTKMVFNLGVDNASINLNYPSYADTSKFGILEFTGTTLSVNMHDTGLSTNLLLKDLSIRNIDGSVEKSIASVRVEDGPSDLLRVAYASPPLDEDLAAISDSSINLISRGIDITFDPQWFSKVLSLVLIPPEINLSSLEAATSAALQDFSSGATRSLMLVLEERQSVAIDLFLVGPRIRIPHISNSTRLEINSGTLSLKSDVDKRRKALLKENSAELKPSDHYDKFNMILKGMQAELQLVKTEDDISTVEKLLSGVELEVLLQNSLTPDNEKLPIIKLGGDLESIQMTMSPGTLSTSLSIVNGILAWAANPSGGSLNTDSDTAAWKSSVQVLPPNYINPANSETQIETIWSTYNATFIPQGYKLVLEDSDPSKPTFVVMISPTLEVTLCEDTKTDLIFDLPQYPNNKKYIEAELPRFRVTVRTETTEDALELFNLVQQAKWALEQWKADKKKASDTYNNARLAQKDENTVAKAVKQEANPKKLELEVEFTLGEVSLLLNKNVDNDLQQISKIRMKSLKTKFTKRPYDMTADISLVSFQFLDLLRKDSLPESDKVFLGIQPKETVHYGVTASFNNVTDPRSTLQLDDNQISLYVSCNQLLLYNDRNTLPAILGYVTEYINVSQGIGSSNDVIFHSHKRTVRHHHHHDDDNNHQQVAQSSSPEIKLNVNMDEFKTVFGNGDSKGENVVVFSATAKTTTVGIVIKPDVSLTVSANMQNFGLKNHFTGSLYPDLISCGKEHDSTFEVVYEQFTVCKEHSSENPQYTAKCQARVGASRIVYLQRTLGQLQRYFDITYLMKDMPSKYIEATSNAAHIAAIAAQDAAASAAADRSGSLNLMEFDVVVAKPTLIIPTSITSSLHANFVVGTLSLKTSLQHVDDCWIEVLLLTITNTSLKLHELGDDTAGNILDDVQLNCTVKRKIVDKENKLPNIQISTSIKDMSVTVCNKQYIAFLEILSSNVLDTWIDEHMAVLQNKTIQTKESEDPTMDGDIHVNKADTSSHVDPGLSDALNLVFSAELHSVSVFILKTEKKPILQSYLRGLNVKYENRLNGCQKTELWMQSLGVADIRNEASPVSKDLLIFGEEDLDDCELTETDNDPLFKMVSAPGSNSLSLYLPPAKITVIPGLLGETMRFFISQDDPVAAELASRNKNLSKLMIKAEENKDHFIVSNAWQKLDSDLFLGPSHRLIVKSNHEGRVVVDGQNKYSVYLTGDCKCTDIVLPPFDVQKFCLVVAKNTTLVFLNTKVYCPGEVQDYVLSGSGGVIVDPKSSSVITRKGNLREIARKEAETKWSLRAVMPKGFMVRIPEEMSDKNSRMIVAVIEGELSVSLNEDHPGSQYVNFKGDRILIFPTTLSTTDDFNQLQIHAVLGPSEIRFIQHLTIDIENSQREERIDFVADRCTIRVSYKDLKTILVAWDNLSKSLWGEQSQATAEDTRIRESLKDVYAPNYTQIGHAADGTTDVLLSEVYEGSSDRTASIKLVTCSLLIIDDQKGYDLELMRVSLLCSDTIPYAVNFRFPLGVAKNGKTTILGDVTINPTVEYMNFGNAAWEPILEPYECSIAFSQKPTESTHVTSQTSIELIGKRPLSFNLSSEVLTSLFRVSEDWTVGLLGKLNPDGTRTRQVGCNEEQNLIGTLFEHSYVVQNNTGMTLLLKGDFVKTNKEYEKQYEERDRKELKISAKTLEFTAGAEGVFSVEIDFGEYGTEKLNLVQNEPFQFFNIPRPLMPQSERLVCGTIWRRGGQLALNLTSRYIVTNKSSLPLEMRVHNSVIPIPACPLDQDLTENNGISETCVPLSSLLHGDCSVAFRSSLPEHEGYHWSTCGEKDLSVTSSKPNHGSLMCGFLGDGVTVKEPLSLYFRRTVRETQVVRRNSQLCVIEIRAPLLLENLLPCPVNVELSRGSNMLDVRAAFRLESGEQREVFSIEMDAEVYAVYTLVSPEGSSQSFTRGKPVLIHKHNMAAHVEEPLIKITDRNTLRECQLVLLSRACVDDTSRAMREVAIYSPYWMLNLSSHEVLFVKDGRGTEVTNGLVRDTVSHPSTPLLFSDDYHIGKGKLSIGVTHSQQSAKFSIDTVGVNGEMQCPDNDVERRIGVSIELAPGKFIRTKVVRVYQRWIFKNKMKHAIVIERAVCGYNNKVIIQADSEESDIPFPLKPKNDEDHFMKIGFFGDEIWENARSTNFKFTDLGTQAVSVMHKVHGVRMVEVKLVQIGAANYVVFSKPSSPPLRVVNNTFHVMTLGDRETGEPELVVQPFSMIAYYPIGSSDKEGHRVRVRSPNIIDSTIEVLVGPEEQRGITEDCDVVAHIKLGQDSLLLVLEQQSMRRPDPRMESRMSSLKVTLQTSFGLSMVMGTGDKREELAYLSMEDVKIEYGQKMESLDLTVSIADIQLDNQMNDSKFQVCLSSDIPRLSAKERAAAGNRDTLFLSIQDYSTRISGMTTMSVFNLLLQEVDVAVDDVFLLRLLLFFNTIVQGEVSVIPMNTQIRTLPEYLESVHGKKDSQRFYADSLILNSMKINLSFQAEQEQLDPIIRAVCMTLSNFHGSLRLAALIIEPVQGTIDDVMSAITNHYVNCIKHEWHKILGSIDMLGNPVGLIGNFGNGVSDLFYEPYLGFKNEEGNFLFGVGKGIGSMGRHSASGVLGSLEGITKSVGGGLGSLSIDDDYVRERNALQRKKATNAVQGIEQGAKAFGKGVFDGVSGLVLKPIEGIRNNDDVLDKVVGVGGGVVKGVLGVTKIASGALDAVGKVMEGAKSQISGYEDLRRKRPPRTLIGGLTEYSHEYSVLQEEVCLICVLFYIV